MNETLPDPAIGQKRRRFFTFVAVPKVQFRYALYSGLLVSVFILLTYLLIVIKLQNAIGTAADATSADGLILVSIVEYLRSAVFAITAIAFSITFLAALIITHRFVGPSIAMQHFIEDMINGTANRKLRFRKNDELNELADSLNRLHEKISSK